MIEIYMSGDATLGEFNEKVLHDIANYIFSKSQLYITVKFIWDNDSENIIARYINPTAGDCNGGI